MSLDKEYRELLREMGLAEGTQDAYVSTLQTLGRRAIEKGYAAIPILSVADLREFRTIAERLNRDPDYILRNKASNNRPQSALMWYGKLLESTAYDIEEDLARVRSDDSLPDTVKEQLVKARLGQGKFRRDLIAYWKACAVTGYRGVKLLRASHIKPWRSSDNRERLDPYNGLLLLPNIDAVFDRGLVTFDEAGSIVLSRNLTSPETMGVRADMKVNLDTSHGKYLEYHRQEIFRT